MLGVGLIGVFAVLVCRWRPLEVRHLSGAVVVEALPTLNRGVWQSMLEALLLLARENMSLLKCLKPGLTGPPTS